jgi:hypothetical protein
MHHPRAMVPFSNNFHIAVKSTTWALSQLLRCLLVTIIWTVRALPAVSDSVLLQGEGLVTSPCDAPQLRRLVIPTGPQAPPDTPASERLTPYNTHLDLGIGHLRPIADWHVRGWFTQIRLPLFQTPHRAPFAWLLDGWLLDVSSGTYRPFGTAGMIETDYESPSFLVYEARPNGWYRLRYARGVDADGTAWSHQCFFKLSTIPLGIERWEERFLSASISPLHFRTKVRHALRATPSISAHRLKWIPAEPDQYHLTPLQVRGDWMQVRVTEPSDYCVSPKAPMIQTYIGWIKWRDEKIGSWLWYYTRGC